MLGDARRTQRVCRRPGRAKSSQPLAGLVPCASHLESLSTGIGPRAADPRGRTDGPSAGEQEISTVGPADSGAPRGVLCATPSSEQPLKEEEMGCWGTRRERAGCTRSWSGIRNQRSVHTRPGDRRTQGQESRTGVRAEETAAAAAAAPLFLPSRRLPSHSHSPRPPDLLPNLTAASFFQPLSPQQQPL